MVLLMLPVQHCNLMHIAISCREFINVQLEYTLKQAFMKPDLATKYANVGVESRRVGGLTVFSDALWQLYESFWL